MYISEPSSGGLQTQYVITMSDFGGNNVGNMEYCYAKIPLNIDDVSDLAYYEQLKEQLGVESTEDVPHRSMGSYEFSDPAHFGLSSGSGTPALASDGLDWPVSLEVLPHGKKSDEDGDVYDRIYEVQMKVYADHVHFPSGDYPGQSGDGTMWIDDASMVASIHANPNKDGWKNLIFNGELYDPYIPPRMRESVLKLISKTTFLDNFHFESVLAQLQTFLDMVRGELS